VPWRVELERAFSLELVWRQQRVVVFEQVTEVFELVKRL